MKTTNGYIILQNGEKGLYYSDGEKIYFPDRQWVSAKPGIATNVHVTIDKSTYAFIVGEMIETGSILDAYIEDLDVKIDIERSNVIDFFNNELLVNIYDEFVRIHPDDFAYMVYTFPQSLEIFANINGKLTKVYDDIYAFVNYRIREHEWKKGFIFKKFSI